MVATRPVLYDEGRRRMGGSSKSSNERYLACFITRVAQGNIPQQ